MNRKLDPTRATLDPAELAALISVDELGEMLGTGPRMPRRLVQERRIPFVKVGRHVRFRLADVAEWLEANTVEAVHGTRTR